MHHLDDITGAIVDEAMRIHKELGPGLLEAVYGVVLARVLEWLGPIHGKQQLTYLRLMHLPVGLLINFGGATLREGLHRIVHQLPPAVSPRLRVNR